MLSIQPNTLCVVVSVRPTSALLKCTDGNWYSVFVVADTVYVAVLSREPPVRTRPSIAVNLNAMLRELSKMGVYVDDAIRNAELPPQRAALVIDMLL